MGIKVGDTVNVGNTQAISGILTDPATLVLVTTDPSGAQVTYNWPTGGNPITRLGLGTFQVPVVASLAGTWTYKWTSTGGTSPKSIGGGFAVDFILETMTVTVTDGTNPVVGVNVQAYTSQEGNLGASGKTNTSGQVVLLLAPGKYEVDINGASMIFANPYSMTVANTGGVTPQTANFAGTPEVIPAAIAPAKVKLYGYVYDGRGLPMPQERVQIESILFGTMRPFVNGSVLGANRWEARTDDNGFWSTDIAVDSTVRVEIPSTRITKTFRVPNDPNIKVLNFSDARPDPGPGGGMGIDTDIPIRDDLGGGVS